MTKKLAASLILGLSLMACLPAGATGQNPAYQQSRSQRKAERKQAKAQKKYLKRQQKAQNKMFRESQKKSYYNQKH